MEVRGIDRYWDDDDLADLVRMRAGPGALLLRDQTYVLRRGGQGLNIGATQPGGPREREGGREVRRNVY